MGWLALIASLLAASDSTVRVVTVPPGAEVRLDGVLLGASPLSFELTPGKHALEVSKSGYSTVKRALAGQGQTLSFELVDFEFKALALRVSKAEAAYDKAEAALQKKQESGKDTQAAEAVMQRASTVLDDATRAHRLLQAQRATDVERADELNRLKDYARNGTRPVAASAPSVRRVDGTDAGRGASAPVAAEPPPEPTFFCAYRHQLLDSVKTKTCSGSSCTSTQGSLNTLTGCSTRSAPTLEQAITSCEQSATARTSTVAGRSSSPLRCQCAEKLSALPPELGRLCQ